MGTVGLSFGSPTSGAGFNVSSTVSQIVGNLQNVETPWKTQLTSLESQDTAISSLGTLFSNLSNDMSSLTDPTGILSEKTGSSSDTNVLTLTAADSSAVAGTHTVEVSSLAQTSSGYLAAITNSTDALSGSITLQVGSGAAQTISVPATSGENTLAGLASAINASGVGISASVLTDSSGSRLSLVSGTSGANGKITVSANSIVDTTTSSGTLAYTSAVTGADAQLTVDGVALTSASNTVANLIPGVTFQLLAPSTSETTSSGTSLEQVQVVIGNDNTEIESTVNQFVSDYNSLISAMNTQEGDNSSGSPEPLFGSPTLTLLQQQLLNGINAQNPNGYLDSIADGAGTTLSGSLTIAVGGGTPDTFVIGSGTNTTNTFYTGSGSDYNTLAGLAAAINAASSGTTLASTVTPGSSTVTSSATLTPIDSASDTLSGALSVQVGSGTVENIVIGAEPSTGAAANTIYTGSGSDYNTLSGLASAINAASSLGFTASVTTAADGASTLTLNSGTSGSAGTLSVSSNIVAAPPLGATASVVTSNGESTLSLISQTAGSSGALVVNSNIVATSDTALNTMVTPGTDASGSTGATTSTATLYSVANANDLLSGSVSIQVGDGAEQTINVGSSSNTLATLADAINGTANIGVTASVVENADDSYSLQLESDTTGSAGSLTVNSSILDTTNTSTATLNYTNSSDINSLTTLGISVNNDGSLAFDANSLDTVLNTDFSSVSGFFQNANSWGQSFSSMLTNAGTSSPTGILALASSSNSDIESTLNADISRENSLISAEQTSLTAELNSANEIMQELPSQLQGVNELYSAISGYNEGSNG
jgi:flagellar hook-associated protein 2